MRPLYIKEIFKEYLEVKNTEYALLVNGGWGSGKTFFWKNELYEIAKAAELNPIYISLNGLKTIDSLQQQLFLRIVPFLGNTENKTFKNLLQLGGNVINKTTKAFIKIDIGDFFKGLSLDGFNFEGNIICFDDMERCQIPIKELLGFMNDFVEHRKLKCIILADENKLKVDETESINYNSIKEKVIGRVLNYEPELLEIIPELFKKYKDQKEYYKFLKENRDYIINVFFEYRENNLRIISFFLENLSKIFREIRIEPKAIQIEVILFTGLISIEFKRGKLKSSDHANPKGIENASYYWYQNIQSNRLGKSIVAEKKEIPQEKSYAEKFYLKYVESRIGEYQYYTSIYSYILSGYYDKEVLKGELEKRKPEQFTPQIKDYRTLAQSNFRALESTEFNRLIGSVLEYADNGLYRIYDYERLSDFYHYFKENKLVEIDHKEIDRILLKGLNEAAKRKDINQKIYDNMIHFSVRQPRVQIIRDNLKLVHESIREESKSNESNQLIEVLMSENYQELKDLFDSNEFSKEFIMYIDGDQLFETLKLISNKTLTGFTEIMKDRYNHINLKDFYPNDLRCLDRLLFLIVNVLKESSTDKLRKFLWEELNDVVEKACVILKVEK